MTLVVGMDSSCWSEHKVVSSDPLFIPILSLFHANLVLSLIHKKLYFPLFYHSSQACQDGHGRFVPGSHEEVPSSRPTGSSLTFVCANFLQPCLLVRSEIALGKETNKPGVCSLVLAIMHTQETLPPKSPPLSEPCNCDYCHYLPALFSLSFLFPPLSIAYPPPPHINTHKQTQHTHITPPCQ